MKNFFLFVFVALLTTMSAAYATAGPPEERAGLQKNVVDSAQQATAGDITIAPSTAAECVTSVDDDVWAPDDECLQQQTQDQDQATSTSSTVAAHTISPPGMLERTAIPNPVSLTKSDEVALSGIGLYEFVRTAAIPADNNQYRIDGSNEVALSGIWNVVVHITNHTPAADLTGVIRSEKNEEVVEFHMISPNVEVRAKGSNAVYTDAVSTIS